MSTLNELGLKYGTDKASSTHGYLDIYEKYLKEWKDLDFTLLEIGVGSGGSLKMWKEYLSTGEIYGIDNNPDLAGENIFIGHQSDEDFLSYVLGNNGMMFTPDIVIDDGSHVGSDIIKTFEFIFPLMDGGSLYFIEDTHTLYNEHYSGPFKQNGRTEAYNFFTDLVYHVDVAGRAMCGKQETAINWPIQEPPVPKYSRILKAAHFYPSLWIFERT